jgi:hypothetical protein
MKAIRGYLESIQKLSQNKKGEMLVRRKRLNSILFSAGMKKQPIDEYLARGNPTGNFTEPKVRRAQ